MTLISLPRSPSFAIHTWFALLLTMALVPSAMAAPSRPNVLFIAIDDLRPELACYGQKQIVSPNIDRLAAQGVLFSRAFAQSPICMSSRASLLTSIHPTRTHITSTTAVIDRDLAGAITLPEAFRQAGYYTVANGKIMHEKSDTAARSWTEPVWMPPVDDLASLDVNSKHLRSAKGRGPVFESADVADNAYPDGQIAEKSASDLRRLSKLGQPFFLACGFIKPHLPFYAPKKYWDLYREEDIAIPSNRTPPENAPTHLAGSREFSNYHLRNLKEGTEEWDRALRHGYYACVSYMDACVGIVLRELESLGIADNTIILFFGDHGWQLGEHGYWGKHNLMRRSLHVPLIVKPPTSFGKFAQGRTATGIVELVDLFPTLLDLSGTAIPAALQSQIEGVSFSPLLRNPSRAWKIASFSWWNNAGNTIVTATHTYTDWPSGQRMMFDLERDPDENVNIADLPAEQAAAAKLQTILHAGWKAALPAR